MCYDPGLPVCRNDVAVHEQFTATGSGSISSTVVCVEKARTVRDLFANAPPSLGTIHGKPITVREPTLDSNYPRKVHEGLGTSELIVRVKPKYRKVIKKPLNTPKGAISSQKLQATRHHMMRCSSLDGNVELQFHVYSTVSDNRAKLRAEHISTAYQVLKLHLYA
jgi:hypothetical protein